MYNIIWVCNNTSLVLCDLKNYITISGSGSDSAHFYGNRIIKLMCQTHFDKMYRHWAIIMYLMHNNNVAICNQEKLGRKDYLKLITSSFDVLLKYAINLMKPECPPLWRSIETANPSFQNHVACMKGYEVIL